MKTIGILCVLLFVAFASAETDHYNPRPTINPSQNPSPTPPIGESGVTLTQKVIGSWFSGQYYTQYDVVIQNNMNRNIKNIVIDTDYTFRLRQPASANLWNMVMLSNGDLVLPSYQNSINAHASYTFGFILEGTPSTPARLAIKSIIYE